MRINQFSPARWAIAFFVPTLPVICAAALYTYLVDPLWQWPHPHHLERWHRGFNERQQKTNYLASRDVSLDTLILGSSRSTYFRPEWLGTENGFNYAVSSGRMGEFAAYIDYAKARSSIPLKAIIIEASEGGVFNSKSSFEEPSYYIANAEDEGKRFKNRFNPSALDLALATRKEPKHSYYLINKFGELKYKLSRKQFSYAEEKQQAVNSELESYKKNVYNNPYNETYPQYLADVHRAAGDAETIVYTPPVSWQLMRLYVEMGHLDDYERWLRELVSEFGKVYHFFYPNPIVMDNGNFNDAQHPTGEASELVISIIMRLRSGEIDEDTEHGGILLTNENIEELLPRFREKMEGLVAQASA